MNADIEKNKKDETHLEFLKLKEKHRILTKLLDNSERGLLVSTQITKALNATIDFDIAFEHALNGFNVDNQENEWIKIDNAQKIKSIQDKLSELLYLDLMISLSGLDMFREHIMSNYIDSIFSSSKTSKTSFNKKDLTNLLNNLSKK